jgi:hypothetical protein
MYVTATASPAGGHRGVTERPPEPGNRTRTDSPHAINATRMFSTTVPISSFAANHERTASVWEANRRTCYEDYRLSQANSRVFPECFLHWFTLRCWAGFTIAR